MSCRWKSDRRWRRQRRWRRREGVVAVLGDEDGARGRRRRRRGRGRASGWQRRSAAAAARRGGGGAWRRGRVTPIGVTDGDQRSREGYRGGGFSVDAFQERLRIYVMCVLPSVWLVDLEDVCVGLNYAVLVLSSLVE
uniref:Uncharacterized protein n=1 Tax=Oryza sativa subsp. japonica TaxID=39947 RepID=Q6H583_ORYSJ|nr:hypothetical protein [Oryza sativa Japonica Group]BAD26116.1 hypothetical protein [Oryza sativa Japonica Group]